ncbi:hypothetical protein [Methylovirgula sp. 4M-Z18]|uniref:hypothetical protein n=1 Tax=Methylovirgula sp. 4M-Z18 TaxID=2293567 RepID=UPI000E2E9BB9|nr:hypothetical protein [Methylovirgula sp. 4M-Z18]RFB80040.1 hypothetical protein DYH55_00355 [Methylovirgula sp. 4M-Z18]
MSNVYEMPQWAITLASALMTGGGGLIGGFLIALVNRGPALQQAVDARLTTLIEGYEHRIRDLTEHIQRLEAKIETLERRLAEVQV